ncbi:hypothetical protein CHS0354_037571 [Potamilus streckersoni]|uniref:Tropomodulin n=1 Tax=Potamilus streckersoni TaxID=2493646 RepID=A0AAE0W235_9BIVA|nr:hypothetical protein CHS0354_037571 [Potamilus streckersoni]
MTNLGIEAIANMLEKDGSIEELNLNQNTSVSLAGWSQLGRALKTNSTLKKMSFDNNPVGDDGIQKITDGLRPNTTLTSLELEHVGMCDRGGKALLSLLIENSTIFTMTINPGNTVSESVQNGIKKYIALNAVKN